MDEYNPYKLSDFEWDVLSAYMKHGYGTLKLYDTTFFTGHFTDETVGLLIAEFFEKVVDDNGNLRINGWRE